VVPVSGETRVNNNAIFGPIFVGTKTIRVPTHLPTIQEAIDTADAGFTILVDSGNYTESVVIDKSLSLIGENRDNTTIRGLGSGMVVHVIVDNVNITGFTVEHSGTASTYYSGILLDEVFNCSIFDNHLTDNSIGILLWECSACSVSGNNSTRNYEYGIFLQNCSSCSISENTARNNKVSTFLNCSTSCSVYCNSIVENDYGIRLTDSGDNRIVHNSFVSNRFAQAYVDEFGNGWDDGYPGGGNYWSDHETEDLYCGPYQNETDSDGIIDTLYTINEHNRDRFPIKKPFAEFSHDIAVLNVTTPETPIGSGQTVKIFVTVKNLGDIAETFNVVAYYNETIAETETVPYLIPTKNDTLTIHWTSVGVAPSNYTLKAEAISVLGETNLENNVYVDGTIELIPAHNVAVTSITPSKTILGVGYAININVTVLNKGTFNETFNVILYADKDITVIGDEIVIGNKTIPFLTNATSTIKAFSWDTTGITKGDYTLTAEVTQVPGETDVTDNILIDGSVLVTTPGDVNGDRKVDMKDIYACILAFMSKPGQPKWNPVCDINNDGVVDMKDIYTAIRNFGKKW